MEKTRNTKQKQLILEILRDSKRPMSINEIYHSIVNDYPKIAKSTIYRNIDTLLQQDLIDKYYLNDQELFYRIKSSSNEHKHYIICDKCKKMFDLPTCPIHDIEQVMRDTGFTITDHYIQITGTCKDCANHILSGKNKISK